MHRTDVGSLLTAKQRCKVGVLIRPLSSLSTDRLPCNFSPLFLHPRPTKYIADTPQASRGGQKSDAGERRFCAVIWQGADKLITHIPQRRFDGFPSNLEDIFIQGSSTFHLSSAPSKNEKGLDEIEVLTLLLPLSDSRPRDRNVRPFAATLGRDIRPTMSSNFA